MRESPIISSQITTAEQGTIWCCSGREICLWAGVSTTPANSGNNGPTQSNVPVAITSSGALAGKTVISIAAGGSHSLALCSDGTLAAWGSNSSGQLGNIGPTQSNVPVAISSFGALAGKIVISIAAGYSHSLALCSDGTVATWGDNYYGQLGNNSTTSSSNVPVAITSSGALAGKTVISIAAGGLHSLAQVSYDEAVGLEFAGIRF